MVLNCTLNTLEVICNTQFYKINKSTPEKSILGQKKLLWLVIESPKINQFLKFVLRNS